MLTREILLKILEDNPYPRIEQDEVTKRWFLVISETSKIEIPSMDDPARNGRFSGQLPSALRKAMAIAALRYYWPDVDTSALAEANEILMETAPAARSTSN